MRRFEPAVPQLQFLVFRVGAEEFGFELDVVQEVVRARSLAASPGSPEFVAGVIELRGVLVPVVDLRRRFGLPRTAADAEARLIVTKLGAERIVVAVDSVVEVLAIPETSLAPPPQYFEGLAAEYLLGIARHDERLILVIDPAHLLTSEERIALERAEWTATEADTSSA